MLLTYKVKSKRKESFSEMYNILLAGGHVEPLAISKLKYVTSDVDPEAVRDALLSSYNIQAMIDRLQILANKFKSLDKAIEDYYNTFEIPKSSGGMRTIYAPIQELKLILKETLYTFMYKLRCLPHDCAYAFTTKRNTKESLITHQENNSKWFLKLDIEDFFPSFGKRFIINQLKDMFPFKYIMEIPEGMTALKTIIEGCLYLDALPQGSPMSPILSNLCFISYDRKLQGLGLVYSRYADDILLSSKYKFDWQPVVNKVKLIVRDNFKIKDSKTRFGSSNGSNWNLGLMLNKDNNITVGWRNKKKLKNKLYKYNTLSDTEKVKLKGLISYYRMVEPEYITNLIELYKNKYNLEI